MTTPSKPSAKPVDASTTPPSPRNNKPRLNWPLIFGGSSVLLLIALIIAGIVFWQNQWHPLQMRASQSQHNVTQLQTQLTTLVEHHQALEQQIAQQTQTLQTALQHPALTQQWDLVTVQELLQQAYLTLYWQKDIASALQLLTLANDTLQTIADPAVYPLRDQLAQEISALSTIPIIDVSDLLTQLNAVAQQLEQLPSTITLPPESSSTLSDTHDTSPTDKTSLDYWQKKLQTLWQQLSQLIVIRHHAQPIEPLLSTMQHQHLLQQLAALMQQAQWAVLHHQASVYQQSLTQVIDRVNRSFDVKAPLTQQVLLQLQTLQQLDLDPALPDIHTSLQQVQRLLKQQFTQPTTESTS
ncbi:MAG: hypothetical protein GKR77_00010 [Legionellales bacterium]|nr:hypothetical protein [Legionellales bacterium]